jgi:hypothetical protein
MHLCVRTSPCHGLQVQAELNVQAKAVDEGKGKRAQCVSL